MLVQFNFKNFKSFKNDVMLDMTATSIHEHQENLIHVKKDENLLKVATILGANASGKSNVLEALALMKYFVIHSFSRFNSDENEEENKLPIKRFLFDEKSKNEKAEFEIFFIQKDYEYQYGFTLDENKIHEEWLYYRTKTRKTLNKLFERVDGAIECGNKFKEAEKFKDAVEDKVLFLTFVAKTKVKQAREVFDWFLRLRNINFGDSLLESIIARKLPVQKLEDENYKKKLEEFLKDIDTGIQGVRYEKDFDGDNERYKVFSKHIDSKGKEYEINFRNESSGTQKMFCLYEYFWDVIKEGGTLIVDELDAKLHPILLRYIINMFNNNTVNINNAQLIYTAHDTYNLTKEMFRRDQIWFTEKDENGVSELYSLIEIKLDGNKKVRNDATYNKDYIMGRYGAIPKLKDFMSEEGAI